MTARTLVKSCVYCGGDAHPGECGQPADGLKILHLAYSDAAGVPGRWAEAHRSIGIDAALVLEVADEYSYGAPATVERWSERWGEEENPAQFIRALVDDCDVVMVYDSPFYLELVLQMGKPVLFRAFGSHSRREPERVMKLLRSPLVRRATAGTGDLALALAIPLVGCPFPSLPRAETQATVAVHSPSHRALKGTETIERLSALAGWDLDVVEGVPHAEVLERKSRCALVIDQFGDPPHPDGIGVAAIEAMAMGLPVVGRASDPVRRIYRQVGCPAVLTTTEAEFFGALDRLRIDALERERLGHRGREWVRYFHNGTIRAREDLAALEVLA